MCSTRYQVLLVFCLSLCFLKGIGVNASSRSSINPCIISSLTSATAFYCQFGHRDSMLNRFPTYRYLGAVEVYLQLSTSPYIKSLTPNYFIDRLEARNEQFLIRNGSVAHLKKAFHAYEQNLTKLEQLTAALGVAVEAQKRDFSELTGDQICDWSLIRQMRKNLWRSFRQFKRELSTAYQTEVVLIAQYVHNVCLFEAVNSLHNVDGSVLPTYVYVRPSLFDGQPRLQHLRGMVVLSRKEGLFSSDTPTIRRDHPDFVGHERALAVFVEAGADGSILSHEFGHLYYLYHHWEDYTKYMERMGNRYQVGGHGTGDASGKAAELAEEGKMPDLHMSWIYRQIWVEEGIDSAVLVHGEEE